MYHIAICDDEKQFVHELQNLICQYAKEKGVEIKVTPYSDGSELTQNYPMDIHLIFLDIKMAHVDGLQAAKAIRQMDSKVR